jgi:ribosomal protein S18 acetylase RimI-like enzyme
LLSIHPITTSQALPLRHSLLRPGRPIATAHFPGDDDTTSRHFGAFRNGQLVGIASLYLTAMPGQPNLRAFQIRGMAVAPEARGTGLGRELTRACIAFAKENHAELLWCNARTTASGFYQKLGFEIIGNQFDIPDVGLHFRMMLSLK